MNVEHGEFRARSPALASQPLLVVAAAFALGILIDRCGGGRFGSFSMVDWWSAGLGMILLAILCYLCEWWRLSLLAVVLATVGLGAASHGLHWNYVTADDLARYATEIDQPVCIEAVATSSSQWSPAARATPLRALPAEPRSAVEMEAVRLRNGTHWEPARGKVRLRVNGVLPDITTGTRLLVFARLGKSLPALNPGQYDHAQAERTAGRHCELFTQSPACVSVIAAASPWSPSRWMDEVSRQCQLQLARYVGSGQRGITQALLLGVRGDIDEQTMDAFMKTGTVHLIVVSGMHVGLIAALVWIVAGLLQLPQGARLGTTISLVLIYAALVGFQPSVTRSTIFVVITLVAVSGFRRATAINGLAAAALLVMAINPAELFRAGTQFSFLGVAAVVAAAQWLPPPAENDPLERMIRSYYSLRQQWVEWSVRKFLMVLVSSLAAWCVLAPAILYHYHVASPSAILLTPLAWLPMAIALVSGLAICTIGFVFPPLAWVLGYVCSGCMVIAEGMVNGAVAVPGSYFYSPGPSTWWLVGYYGVLVIAALMPARQFSWKTLSTFAALWTALGFAAASGNHNDGHTLRCSVLAVGHGTCVVLEFPSGETMLYDAGSLGSPETATHTIAGYLWSRGITSIDAIVISHADVDHYNGVPGLLERFAVGRVLVSPLMFDPWATDGQLDAPNYLKEQIDAAGVPLQEVWMNDRLRVADERVRVEVLHPPRAGVPGRDNANSVLLAIEFAGRRILLPGDLEAPGLETVIAEQPLDVDVLLAPHHGSKFSDPPGFAAWCTPDWVVLSGRYSQDETRLTTTSYRNVGAQVLRTAECGAVTFTIGAEGVACIPHRN